MVIERSSRVHPALYTHTQAHVTTHCVMSGRSSRRADFDRIAEAIRADRLRRGLTQDAYAPVIGLSQNKVSKLEGRVFRRLTADVADAIRRILGEIPMRAETGTTDADDPARMVEEPVTLETILRAVETLRLALPALITDAIREALQPPGRRRPRRRQGRGAA